MAMLLRCSQLQELRVALGWKERFSPMCSSFMILDMGLHMPKSALPRCLHVHKFGRLNTEKRLPTRPVESYCTANIFHAYTRDLHLRSLHFDMNEEKEWVSSFFTAPGSVECMLGQSSPYMVSMRVAGEWMWDAKRGSISEAWVPNRALVNYLGKKEEADQTRRRLFHVRCAPLTHILLETLQLCSSLSMHHQHAACLEPSTLVWLSTMSWCMSCHPSSCCTNHECCLYMQLALVCNRQPLSCRSSCCMSAWCTMAMFRQ
jgi:hypothetical protein